MTFFSERNDPIYCFELIKKLKVAKEKNPLAKIYYHEYFINQTLLDNVIPLEGELVELKKIQNAFSEIKNQDLITHIKNPNLQRNIKISTTINRDQYFQAMLMCQLDMLDSLLQIIIVL